MAKGEDGVEPRCLFLRRGFARHGHHEAFSGCVEEVCQGAGPGRAPVEYYAGISDECLCLVIAQAVFAGTQVHHESDVHPAVANVSGS